MEVFSSNYGEWLPQVDRLVIELHSHECTVAFQKAITMNRLCCPAVRN
jgi:hypothetical protein